MTNSDRIRAFTDDALAEFIIDTEVCESVCAEYDPMGEYLDIKCDNECVKHYVEWLKKEVTNEKN